MSRFTQPYIEGLTLALPKKKRHLTELGFDPQVIRRIIKMTGIEDTCVSDINKTAADYSIDAANHLFEHLNINRSEIDGVVFVSGYPDYIQPCTAGVIQDRLGLAKRIVAIDINHVCSGFIYGLLEAFMLIQTEVCKKVLLCMGDIAATRSIHPKDKSGVTVAGDSGAAILITASKKDNFITEFSFSHDGSRADCLGILVGSNRYPARPGVTDVEKVDGNGNVRTDENWYMDGLEVMRFAMTDVHPCVNEVLKKCEWDKSEVDVYGFHQANEFIVKKIANQMELSMDKVPIYVKNTGNLGPDSIPWALIQHSHVQDSKQWKKVILCGFGAGLSCGTVGLDLSFTQFIDPIES